MSARISPVVREQAARICAQMAKDTRQVDEDVCRMLFGHEVPEAIELASQAWLAVDPEPLGIEDPLDPKRELEAERMIRAGWCPGDRADDYEGEGDGEGAACARCGDTGVLVYVMSGNEPYTASFCNCPAGEARR